MWECPSQLRRPKAWPAEEAGVLRFELFEDEAPEGGCTGSVEGGGGSTGVGTLIS